MSGLQRPWRYIRWTDWETGRGCRYFKKDSHAACGNCCESLGSTEVGREKCQNLLGFFPSDKSHKIAFSKNQIKEKKDDMEKTGGHQGTTKIK